VLVALYFGKAAAAAAGEAAEENIQTEAARKKA